MVKDIFESRDMVLGGLVQVNPADRSKMSEFGCILCQHLSTFRVLLLGQL